MKKRRRNLRTSTVEEVQDQVQAFRHRHVVLGYLIAELDLRFGNEDADFLRIDGRYEPPRRDVVQQLRGELIRAQINAHQHYTELASETVGVDARFFTPEEENVIGD